jgi:hypothetical protein
LANWPRCCSIDPDVTARAIWQSGDLGEKCPQFCLRNISIHARKPVTDICIPIFEKLIASRFMIEEILGIYL